MKKILAVALMVLALAAASVGLAGFARRDLEPVPPIDMVDIGPTAGPSRSKDRPRRARNRERREANAAETGVPSSPAGHADQPGTVAADPIPAGTRSDDDDGNDGSTEDDDDTDDGGGGDTDDGEADDD